MSEACPCCRLPLWFDGVQFQDGVHCPDSMALNVAVRDELGCLRAAVAQRDATIRAQDELLGRARQVLVDVGERLTEALQRMPEEARGG
jgi:hypothetical protein